MVISSKRFSRPYVLFPILLGLWVLTYWPILPALVSTWLQNSNNSHGILVPFISIYLIWMKREKLSSINLESSPWGAAMLCLSIVLYVISYIGSVAIISRGMLVLSLIGLVMYNLGISIFKSIAFPLVFLFFMVPVPETVYTAIALPLQLLASDYSAGIIRIFGIPVLQEGNMLYFAEAQLEVAEACSGLRSLTAFLMLGCLFAYLPGLDLKRRCILLSLAFPLSFLVNISRVVGTGILAHFFGGKVARGFLHDFSGLAVFALGFLLLFAQYQLLRMKKTAND